MFPLVFEVFWKAEDGWSATWSQACCRCSFYLFGECDFLLVYLKKFGVRLHRLHAWRFLLSAPCTLQCPDDLNPTRLPGCADRSALQPGLGPCTIPCLLLFNLAPFQLTSDIAVPQAGVALQGCTAQGSAGGFPLSPVSVLGGGIKTAVHNIFKNFRGPLCFLWVSGQVVAAYEGSGLSACQETKGLGWCHTGWIWIALVRKSSCGYLGDEYEPFWFLTSEF